MIKRGRSILMILSVVLAILVSALGFWLLVTLDISGEGVTELAAAQKALDAVGLPESAASPALAMNTQGWMGEGEIMTVFEASQPLMAAIAQTPGWRVEAVTAADYALLANQCFQDVPLISPAPGTVFEAWYYDSLVTMKDAPARINSALPEIFRSALSTPSTDWQIAFFDADTGTFFYYRWIS